MFSAPAHLPVPVPARNPPEFVSLTESFPRSYCERWLKGSAAEQRVRQLRKAFGQSVRTRTVNDVRKLWSDLGGERQTVVLTEITYIAASRALIPAFTVDDRRAA